MSALDDYLGELAARLRAALGPELLGVYAGGSYALGAYEPGRSDVDVAAVVRSPLDRERQDELVGSVRHEALPCPARGLELVVYRLDAAREPTAVAAFELNLNTGARMAFRVDHEPDPAETHWFAIDRGILAAAGVAVAGPPAAEVFAPIPREQLLPVLVQGLRWHTGGKARGDDGVLNACRARRYAQEGVWSSKPAAGAWAVEQGAPPIVAAALAARNGRDTLDRDAVRRFVTAAADELGRL